MKKNRFIRLVDGFSWFLGSRSSPFNIVNIVRTRGTLQDFSQRLFLAIGGLVIVSSVSMISINTLLSLPSAAQTFDPLETATVELDGYPIFEVTAFSEQSAVERADDISSELANAVEEERTAIQDGIEIYLVDTNPDGDDSEQISEQINEDDSDPQKLLTVRKNDAVAQNKAQGENLSPEEIAFQWTAEINDGLKIAKTERSLDFLRRATLKTILAILFAAIAHWWLKRFQTSIMAHPLQELQHLLNDAEPENTQIRSSLLKILLSTALFLARVAIWCATVLYVVNLFPQTRDRSYEIVRAFRDSLFSPILPLGGRSYSVTDLFILIAAFFGVFIGATVIANMLRSRILNMAGIGTGSQEAIAALTRYSLIVIGSLVVLQVWGLDLSSLTLLASALGIGIGLGFQNIVRDFGSGLILLFERPVQVGDFVEVGAFQGTVDRIGARSTSVKTLDQVSIIVPNSYFLENQVINWSHENPLSRISIPIGVSYSSDPEHIQNILLKAAESNVSVVHFPKPQVFFKGFGDSSLDFILLVWIMEPRRHLIIKSDLYFQVFALFKQENIEIPFPQRDLHVRSSSLPADIRLQQQPNKRNPTDQTEY